MCVEMNELRNEVDKPTSEQEIVINSSGPILLNACPGSGKTWTAARMFVHRVTKLNDKKRGIAFLSYTNVAISEFKRAVQQLNCDINEGSGNFAGTLDTFVDKYIIGPYFYLLPGVKERPYCCGDSLGDNCGARLESGRCLRRLRIEDVKCVCEDMRFRFVCKNSKHKCNYDRCLNWKDVQKELCDVLANQRGYTHNMRWLMAVFILRHKGVRRNISHRFSEVILDEAQDTNALSLVLLDVIKEASTLPFNISLIGDIKQTIFEFSGASLTVFNRYVEKWGLQQFQLDCSLRFSESISNAINQIFGQNNKSINGEGGNGVFYITTSDYSKARLKIILDKFGICHENTVILKRKNLPHRIPQIIKEITDFCRERDDHCNLQSSYFKLLSVLRSISHNDFSNIDSKAVIPDVWRLTKDKMMIPSLDEPAKRWIACVHDALDLTAKRLQIELDLSSVASCEVYDESKPMSYNISHGVKSIHSAKGETYEGVIVEGDMRYWNEVETNIRSCELLGSGAEAAELRTFYVAMTRARRFVLLVIPDNCVTKADSYWRQSVSRIMFNECGNIDVIKPY